jgi:8-oxo-dGTP pyrophosphatase MutT (NUDIX family)
VRTGARLSLDHVAAAVSDRGPAREVPGVPRDGRRSAVLVALYEHAGEPWVVLTRRASHLRTHRGEVSFPGGGVEPGDVDMWATALREACEEIGLDPGLAEPVGELDSFVTVGSRSRVQPLVAVLTKRPEELTPNPDEVDHILHVTLSELMLEEVFREELWPIAESVRPVSFFELYGDTVWGATGAMLRQLLVIATGSEEHGPPLALPG